MAVEVGSRIGPYQIVAPLGAGGMGEVFRARDERLNREVALKVLPDAVAGDPERLRRFEQEARSAGGLNDPNVLVVYDFGTHEGRPYLVTELLEGMTLRDRLREGPLPIRKALELGAQLARGLAAAHDRGIVHRDIKPDNLFLTRDGRLKILDFGVARTLEAKAEQGTLPLTGQGAVLGTAGYMSPEQVRGQPADERSDLFSFGAVLYELLSGARAFDGQTPVDRGYAILNEEPQPLASRVPNLSPAAAALVLRCLEKNPEERFQSARDLAYTLEAMAQPTGEGTGLQRIGAPAAGAPVRRRALLGATLVGAPALFAAGFFTRALLERRRSAAGLPGDRHHFTRLTFRPAMLSGAFFAPEGTSVFFSAGFEDSLPRVYSALPGQPGLRPLTGEGMQLASVSRNSELALLRIREEGEHDRSQAGTTLARMPLSGASARDVLRDVAWASFGPDDKLLVVRVSNTGFTLEYPLGTKLLEGPEWISHPRLSRSGQQIAYAFHPVLGDDRGWIEVLDLKGSRRRLTPEWYTIQGVAWSPDDQEVWFTGSEEVVLRHVYAVSLEGRLRPVLKAPSNLRIADCARDGRVLVARQSTRYKMKVWLPGWEQERDLSLFDASLPRSISDDGTRLLFDEGVETSRGDYDSYVRDTVTGAVVSIGKGYGRALSGDGRWVALSRAPKYEDLTLVPTGPGSSRPLDVTGVGRILMCHFFPDGQSLLVFSVVDGEEVLFRVHLDGKKPERLLAVPGLLFVGPPSADGLRVPIQAADGKSFIAALPDGALTPLELPRGRPLRFAADGAVYFVHSEIKARRMNLGLYDPRTKQSKAIGTLAPTEGGLVGGFRGGAIAPNGAYVYSYTVSNDELFLAEGLA